MDSVNSEFGKRLAELRKSEGLTREDFAKELNMSINTLRNYENGLREPGHNFVIQMATRFDVTTDYILGLSTTIENRSISETQTSVSELDEKENSLIHTYRQLNMEGQEKLLGYGEDLIHSGRYEQEETVRVFRAAHSKENKDTEIVEVPKSLIDRLKAAKSVDEI